MSANFSVEMDELRRTYQHKRVRIKRGATIISTTHPTRPAPRKLLRSITIHCHSVFPAYQDSATEKERPATLTYAGRGGYWVDVVLDPEYVQVVDP